MHFNFLFLFLCLNFMSASAFFLWKLKKEPLFFCYKVCPLYCSKHLKNRRYDLDSAASSYIEDKWPGSSGSGSPGYWEEPDDNSHDHIYPPLDHHHHSDHHPHEYEVVKHVKLVYHPWVPPTTTTTTAKPTTEAPSGICEACMKKCYPWQLPDESPWW